MWDEKSAISASADRKIWHWSINSEEEAQSFKGHGAAVT